MFTNSVKDDQESKLNELMSKLEILEVQERVEQNEMNKVFEDISNFFKSVALKTFGTVKKNKSSNY